MIIEKRNTKMFNIISIVLLTAILLTVVGGIIVQRLNPPSTLGETGTGRGHSLLQPESTQTSPTGSLVMTTGIVLLTIGFITIVALWLWLHRNPS